MCTVSSIFYLVLGIGTWTSCLHNRHSAHWAISPPPQSKTSYDHIPPEASSDPSFWWGDLDLQELKTSVLATAGCEAESSGPSTGGLYTCWHPVASSIMGMCQEELYGQAACGSLRQCPQLVLCLLLQEHLGTDHLAPLPPGCFNCFVPNSC